MTPLILPAAELKSGLTGLGKVINPKCALPVLHTLRVERTTEGWICLTATDLYLFATLRLEQPAKGEPFALLLPYADLLRLVKSCGKDDSLQVTPGADCTAVIASTLGSQTRETTVPSPPVQDFPVIPKVFTGKPYPVPEELRSALHEALVCSGTDPTRTVLQGAFLDVTRPKAHYVVATDGRHLYSCNSFQLPFAKPLIIPRHKFLLWREFNLDGPWHLKVGGSADPKDPGWVQLSSRRWRFISRQIDGPYPNWRAVVPDFKPTLTLEMDAASLDEVIHALERLPCHDERFHTLGLEWKDGVLKLLGKERPGDPWTRVPLKTTRGEGRDLTVFVDRQYVLKALSFGLTSIELMDELTPLRFSRDGRQMIVMPLRGDVVRQEAQQRPPRRSPAPPRRAPAPPPSSTLPPRAETTPNPAMPEPHDPSNPAPVTPGGTRRITATDDSHGADRTGPPERPALEAALARLETLKAGFREAVSDLTRLGDTLKQVLRDQRVRQRETQTMRSTLRSLQSLRF